MTPRLFLLPFLALLPQAVSAGALSDLLMAPNVFAEAPVGSEVAYTEDRVVPDGGTLTDVTGGAVRLEVHADGADRSLILVKEADGKPQPMGTFPTGVANPLLLYFLETTVRAVAEKTGGSPYYIRNRIREALVAADLGSGDGAREVVLTPFATDANKAKMGVFADLTIRLRFDPARPDRILELSADTAAGADGYHEKLVLIAED